MHEDDPRVSVLRGPVGFTIADLIALSCGTAIALVPLGELSPISIGSWFSRSPFGVLYSVLSLATFALVPVILARRLRCGGPVRPAEFLVLCGGLQVYFGRLNTILGSFSDVYFFSYKSQELREVLFLTLAILGSVVWHAGRHRLPNLLLSILLVLVWCGIFENFPYVMHQGLTKLGLGHPSSQNRAAIQAILVGHGPWSFLYLVLVILAVRSWRQTDESMYWAEWLGLFVLAGRLVCWECFLSQNLRRSGNYVSGLISVRIPSLVLACLLCALVFRIWDRRACRKSGSQTLHVIGNEASASESSR